MNSKPLPIAVTTAASSAEWLTLEGLNEAAGAAVKGRSQ